MYRKSTTYLDPGFWEPDFLCQSLPSKHVGIMRPFKFWKRDKNTHLKVMISHSVNNVEGSVRLRKTNFTYFRENISKNVCLIKNKREKGVLLLLEESRMLDLLCEKTKIILCIDSSVLL